MVLVCLKFVNIVYVKNWQINNKWTAFDDGAAEKYVSRRLLWIEILKGLKCKLKLKKRRKVTMTHLSFEHKMSQTYLIKHSLLLNSLQVEI